jgi:ubiquinone/menaquinone biosynthesis C-methylase UbiE
MTTSLERAHYEDPALWAATSFTNAEIQRAQLAVQWLPPSTESILDVGCGNGVLATAFPDPRKEERSGNELQNVRLAVGLDRSLFALRQSKTAAPTAERSGVTHCQADASHLPFASETFDAVVCMEVIEHLPFQVFKEAVAELARVARHCVLVTVPYQEDRDAQRVRCPLCGCQFNPYYHMRSFDLPGLEGLYSSPRSSQGEAEWVSREGSVTAERIEGIGPIRVPLFLTVRSAIRNTFFLRWVEFPEYSVCPQCGYHRERITGQKGAEGAQHAQQSGGGLGRLLRLLARVIWPTKKAYCWWMALYTKERTLGDASMTTAKRSGVE